MHTLQKMKSVNVFKVFLFQIKVYYSTYSAKYYLSIHISNDFC